MDKSTDNQTTKERYLANLNDERSSADLYKMMSELEKNPKLAEFYRRLSSTEQAHADAWAKRLTDMGAPVPPYRPGWRTRVLKWIAQRFGVSAVLPTLTSMEDTGVHGYSGPSADVEEQSFASTEQTHARMLRQIGQSGSGGLAGSAVAQIEGRHRTAGGNALRAAVLGANDGLVSNLSLVMGVAGAELAGGTILVTGFAGLLAGAISMALGEWISVQSSRELYQKQLRTEEEEIATAPEEEAEELTLIYQARGLNEENARQLAQRIMSDSEHALDTLARDELGIDPEELGGSAWEAALTSFFLFAIGAIIPVIPFIFLSGLTAAAVSAAFSAVGLFLIGTSITLFTGRTVLYSGTRQVLFGLAAAAITYAIGRLIGVGIAG